MSASSLWTDGYVTDIGYTHGYYSTLNPVRLQLALTAAGLVCPQVQNACELGFGQGLSINLHAAASPVLWAGNDFNQEQVAHAATLAQAGASGRLQLQAASFAEFCTREDLPQFDFIAMHGVWSWVSAANRTLLRQFVERRLRPGGVLYISYNTQPGWAAFMPLRDLLLQHFEQPANAGLGSAKRIDAALDFAEQLLAADPVYAQANPFMQERVQLLRQQSRQYLAHEYFNRDWHVTSFAGMTELWTEAGLQFACSADFRDHLDAANLTPAQRQFCTAIDDPGMRQSVRDFMVNQQFRRDYWVRGAERLTPDAQHSLLAQQRVVLLSVPEQISMKQKTVASEINLNPQVYEPIIDVLADFQVHSLGEISGLVGNGRFGLQQVLDALMMLIGCGHAAPAQSAADCASGSAASAALNRHLLSLSAQHGEIEYLSSPVTGGGVAADRIQQLFMLAVLEQQQTPADIIGFVWRYMCAQDKKLVKDGVRLESEQDNLAELNQLAQRFFLERLPLLQALQVV